MFEYSLLAFIFIGLVAGWLASKIMKGKGSGLLINLVIGVVGAFIGGKVLGFVGIESNNLIGSILTAIFGAIILLWIVNQISRK